MYVWGLPVTAYSDHHALIWLKTKKDLAGRLARWSLILMEYDLTIRYRSGKLQVNADTLSRYPVDEPEGEEEDEGKFLSLSLLTKENGGPLTDTATDAGRIRLRTAQRETAQWRGAMDQLEAGGSCGPFRLQGGILYIQTPRGKEAFNRLCTPEYY